MSAWLRLYGDDEDVGLVTYEATHQRLVLIRLGTLDRHALTFARHVIRLHVRCFSKYQLLCRNAILLGYLHQVRDGNVQLSLFYSLILLSTDANGFGHLADRNVEHVAQSTQSLANLF